LEVRGVHSFSNKLWPNQQFVDVGVYIFHPTKKQIQHFVLLLYITYPICKTFSIEHSHCLFSHNFSSKALQKTKGMKIPCQNSNPTTTPMVSLQIWLQKVHG
jgi:hypothetical protein